MGEYINNVDVCGVHEDIMVYVSVTMLYTAAQKSHYIHQIITILATSENV